jgi:hypothetical protein
MGGSVTSSERLVLKNGQATEEGEALGVLTVRRRNR